MWADVFTQEGRQYDYATVNSFTGQVSTGCGPATSAVGPFYCPADSEVYLDLTSSTSWPAGSAPPATSPRRT